METEKKKNWTVTDVKALGGLGTMMIIGAANFWNPLGWIIFIIALLVCGSGVYEIFWDLIFPPKKKS